MAEFKGMSLYTKPIVLRIPYDNLAFFFVIFCIADEDIVVDRRDTPKSNRTFICNKEAVSSSLRAFLCKDSLQLPLHLVKR